MHAPATRTGRRRIHRTTPRSGALNWQLLFDGLLTLGVAMAFGVIAERLRQSAIVGFMLAGLVVGPRVTGAVMNDASIVSIAGVGVTLLMFTIGLEFAWSKLKNLGLRAVAAGSLQVVVTTLIAAAVVRLFGWAFEAGVAIGAAVAMSSTGVVMPALGAAGEQDTTHGRFDLGLLLVQDAAVIPAILLVGALTAGGEGGGAAEVAAATAYSFAVVAGFVAFFAAFNQWAMPALVAFTAPTRNRETPVLFAILASLGAAWAANALGLSPALGAFIAAIFLGESVIATQLRGDIAPLRIVFVTLFFASIGMLADPGWMLTHPLTLATAVLLVVFGKAGVVAGVGLAFRLPLRSAVAAGLCMGQVGVFSFVIGQLAFDPGEGRTPILDEGLFNTLISVTIATLFLTPYLVGNAARVGVAVEGLARRLGLVRADPQTQAAATAERAGHVVIVGFGPAGRAVAARASEAGTAVTVVDLNPASIRAARVSGHAAYVGDASRPQLLAIVGLGRAESLVIALPDHRLSTAVIVEARALAPKLRIVTRARYHRHVPLLSAAGSDVVIDEEAAAGAGLADALSLTGRLPVRSGEATGEAALKEAATTAPATGSR